MQSMSFMINRWLLSTNAKDIGILYIIFAGLSGLVGSALSFKIRKELSGGGKVYFLGNYHDYNVTITGHGIVKIFFKVKPALIGGFGKLLLVPLNNEGSNATDINNDTNIIHFHANKGPYLAGLIEGDGTIIVPDPLLKNRSAIIRICFNINDLALGKQLIEKIGHGKLVYPKVGNYFLQELTTFAGLYTMATMVNGYFRTPKQEAQNRQIEWINIRTLDYQKKEPIISKKGQDFSPIFNNAWLSGMIDADGNFNVIIAPRKNSNNVRIQAQFRLELRQHYHRTTVQNTVGTSYVDIKSIIATYQGVNVYNRARLCGESMTYQYFFVAGSKKSQILIRTYLDKHPQFSSKHLDYLDWCKIIDLNNLNFTKEEMVSQASYLKAGINSKRIKFTWFHLTKFI